MSIKHLYWYLSFNNEIGIKFNFNSSDFAVIIVLCVCGIHNISVRGAEYFYIVLITQLLRRQKGSPWRYSNSSSEQRVVTEWGRKTEGVGGVTSTACASAAVGRTYSQLWSLAGKKNRSVRDRPPEGSASCGAAPCGSHTLSCTWGPGTDGQSERQRPAERKSKGQLVRQIDRPTLCLHL